MPSRRRDTGRPNAYGRLLEAAIEGLAGGRLSVAHVCRAAGVQAPALYYHFGSKEGLIAAATEAVGHAWLDRIAGSLPPEGDLAARITAARTAWQSFIEAPDRPVTLLIRVGLEFANDSEPICAGLKRVYDAARQVVCEEIQAVTGPIDGVETIAETVMGLVQAAALAFELDSDSRALERRLESAGEMLVLLLARAVRHSA